jgi:hypothetical protein
MCQTEVSGRVLERKRYVGKDLDRVGLGWAGLVSMARLTFRIAECRRIGECGGYYALLAAYGYESGACGEGYSDESDGYDLGQSGDGQGNDKKERHVISLEISFTNI